MSGLATPGATPGIVRGSPNYPKVQGPLTIQLMRLRGRGGPHQVREVQHAHCMVSVTCLSLFSSHSLCTLKLTLTEMSFLKQHLPVFNCLLNTPGDSCSLAESWAVTGAGACALYCAVQSAVHSTDARCRLARHNDRDQSLV